MILSAICCTWKRPHYLGELIECFLRQGYPFPKRELVILDAEALTDVDWSWPEKVYMESEGTLYERDTHGLYHAAHAFRRSRFSELSGYRAMNNGEDQELFFRLRQAKAKEAKPSNRLSGKASLCCTHKRSYATNLKTVHFFMPGL